MLQRFAAKRVRGESDVLAARFGDYADLDVFAPPHTALERQGISPAQRQNLPTASAEGAAAVRPRRLRRAIMPGRGQRKLRLLRAAQESRAGEAVRSSRALGAAADARLEISRRAVQRRQVARPVAVGPKCPVSGCPFEGDSLEATRRRWRRPHSPRAADAGAFRCDRPACGRVPAYETRLSLRQHVAAVRPEKLLYLGVRYCGPKAVREVAGGRPRPRLGRVAVRAYPKGPPSVAAGGGAPRSKIPRGRGRVPGMPGALRGGALLRVVWRASPLGGGALPTRRPGAVDPDAASHLGGMVARVDELRRSGGPRGHEAGRNGMACDPLRGRVVGGGAEGAPKFRRAPRPREEAAPDGARKHRARQFVGRGAGGAGREPRATSDSAGPPPQKGCGRAERGGRAPRRRVFG